MTRRIICYVVFAMLIWSANTQNEENTHDNKFKSNMTRNDFSNLLSSLIKLNEQRVSVLQRLYKLEDYGVLSEVLRTGDRKPDEGKGNPNNLFLIVMSKNKTDPSRRNIDVEIVDSVPSLDVGSKKVHPELNYVLDPAGYISQNAHKENSIETMFGNIPKVHRPKKTLLIDDGNKENTTAKKKLKGPAKRTEMSTSILKTKKTVAKAKKEKEKGNEKSKPHHQREIFVNKVNTMEDAISNNNHKYKDREDEHDYIDTLSFNNQTHKKSEEKEDENDYGSPFSKEFAENVPNHNFTEIESDSSIQKVHSNNTPKSKKKIHTPMIKAQGDQHPKFNRNRILNNYYNKYTVILEEIKPTTEKVTDKTNNNQKDKLLLGDKDLEDENYYGSPFSKEYDENGPNRQSTKIDDYTPKIIVQYKQPLNFNRSKSIMEQDTTYSTTNTDLTAITVKKDIKLVSTVNIDLTDSRIEHKHLSKEKENIRTLSRKNASWSEIPKITKGLPFKYYDDNNYPKDDGNKTNKEDPGIAKDSPDEVEYEDEEEGNNTNHGTGNPLSPNENSENVDVKTTLPVKKNSPSHLQDVTENSNKTNKEKPGIAKNSPNEVLYEDEEPENNTNHGTDNPSPPIMLSENVDVHTTLRVKTYSLLHPEDVTENSNKYKPKAAVDLRLGNNSNAKANNRGDFIIDQTKGNGFSIVVTHMGKEKPEEIKQPENFVVNPKAFDQPEDKPIARKAFQKCLNKKAKKLCCKSCISAYKNVCTRLKCTSKAKKALKKECKKSCEKTFRSSSSKYSDEGSDNSGSDNSDSDHSGSDNSGSDSSDSNSS